jgi:hypothetical protein
MRLALRHHWVAETESRFSLAKVLIYVIIGPTIQDEGGDVLGRAERAAEKGLASPDLEHPMPPLTDPERSKCYLNALRNWNITGYVNFAERAWEWLRGEFPSYTQREVARLLYAHVGTDPSKVDEQPEQREGWRDRYEFHHDIRMPIQGRRIYFETRLEYNDPDDPDDPQINVVNVHDA